MTHKPLKTPEQVRAEFDRRGVSIAEWSRRHGFSSALVVQILQGKRRSCVRGQSHRIAVMLGIKAGELVSDADAMTVVQPPARAVAAAAVAAVAAAAAAPASTPTHRTPQRSRPARAVAA